jgi:Flp pilus assembly protein TadG
MADDSSGASGAVWALVTLLLILIVVGALYFGGAFSSKKSIDINIQKPNLVLKV